MSFDEFKNAAKPVPIKSTKETLADVEEILNSTKWSLDNGNI